LGTVLVLKKGGRKRSGIRAPNPQRGESPCGTAKNLPHSSTESNDKIDFKFEPSSGLIDALMEIGKERANILEAMKAALLRGDEDEALERARDLMGLPRKRPKDSRS